MRRFGTCGRTARFPEWRSLWSGDPAGQLGAFKLFCRTQEVDNINPYLPLVRIFGEVEPPHLRHRAVGDLILYENLEPSLRPLRP